MHTIYFSDANASRSLPPGAAHSEEQASLLRGKRVVIVEDEGITQMQLRKILVREGVTIVGAAMSGPDGVEVILREKPDMALIDIRMPGAFDGLEAARRILAEHRVCIVMLTAFSDEAYREQARNIGTSGYIVKPIDKDTLLPQLEAALKNYQPQ